jgi:hypothetical protein
LPAARYREFGRNCVVQLIATVIGGTVEWPVFTFSKLCAYSPGALPRWKTVNGLTKSDSDAYQNMALKIASAMGIVRVHLDAIWWGERADSEVVATDTAE